MEHIKSLIDASLKPQLALGVEPVIPSFLKSVPKIGESTDQAGEAHGSRVIKTGRPDGIAFARRKAEEAMARQATATPVALQALLPLWDEDHRGVPNPLIRSGLFSVRQTPKRESYIDEHIASLSNFHVLYRGIELRQDDLSVWMALLTMSRKFPVDAPILFSGYGLIKDLGWRLHSESYARAKECIERLKFTSLKITVADEKSMYAGSLIRDFAYDAPDGKGNNTRWMVRLESGIAKMFMNENTTLVEWEQRKSIGPRAALTLWLHSYFSSHRDPIPISVQKIHELCKSEQASMANFKIRVRQSLETLISIGHLASYSIANDMVKVEKAGYRKRIA